MREAGESDREHAAGAHAAREHAARPAPPARVTVGELVEVVVAQGALVAALLRARVRPVGRLVAPSRPAYGAATPAPSSLPPGRALATARMVRALDRAARRGLFRPTCLVRSLALARLLEGRGVTGARVRIGVRREEPAGGEAMVAEAGGGATISSGGGPRSGRRVLAHAWVELDGRVVGDDPRHVATFAPLGAVDTLTLRWR